MNLDFKQTVESIKPASLKFGKLQTLQVNLGNRCNQRCMHCHVQGGPEGQKIMPRKVMLKIIDFLSRYRGLVVDIPEKVLGEGVGIITAEHCFCCAARTGSSCTGSLVKSQS